jgi:chromosome partitioning protein
MAVMEKRGEAPARPGAAHVVVVASEKGGTGKSTLAIHIAVALLKARRRVATIDLDSRQQSFTRHIERRRRWASSIGRTLELPRHHCVALGESVRLDDNETSEFTAFTTAVEAIEDTCDFVVIDAPGADTFLARLAHAMADTLVTPLNDSMVDLDILGLVDPVTLELTGTSHYADVVHKAVHQRRALDGTRPDWIVVRNRLSGAVTGNKRIVAAALEALSGVLGFRFLDGFAERAVYREFFARGLTALDPLDIAVLGTRPSLSHAAAQEEVCALLGALRLPAYDRRRLAAARLQPTAAHQPVAFQDIRVD